MRVFVRNFSVLWALQRLKDSIYQRKKAIRTLEQELDDLQLAVCTVSGQGWQTWPFQLVLLAQDSCTELFLTWNLQERRHLL